MKLVSPKLSVNLVGLLNCLVEKKKQMVVKYFRLNQPSISNIYSKSKFIFNLLSLAPILLSGFNSLVYGNYLQTFIEFVFVIIQRYVIIQYPHGLSSLFTNIVFNFICLIFYFELNFIFVLIMFVSRLLMFFFFTLNFI